MKLWNQITVLNEKLYELIKLLTWRLEDVISTQGNPNIRQGSHLNAILAELTTN